MTPEAAMTLTTPQPLVMPGARRRSPRAWRGLLVGLMLFCGHTATSVAADGSAGGGNDPAGFEVFLPESLDQVYDTACPSAPEPRARQQSIWGNGWWSIRITRDLLPGDRPVLVFEIPFQSHFQVWLPGATAPIERSKTGPSRDFSYPARLAVFPIEQGLRAGDRIDLCVQYQTFSEIRIQLIDESRLQRQILGEERRIALSSGTIAAMVLAGIGMAIAVRNVVFLLLASGLFFALLYLLASSAWVFEIPGLARVAEVWSLQRIGGKGAALLIGLALGYYINLPRRMPVVWQIMQVLLLVVAVLLLVSFIPASIEWNIVAQLGNTALIMICLVLFGSGIYGAVQGHHPSRVLLLAWTPPVVLVIWLTFEVMFFSGWSPVLDWLFPLGMIYSSTALFVGLADEIARYRSQRDRAKLLADHDGLTGVLSRRALDAALQSKCSEANRRKEPIAILFLDVDNFKRVNDELGHEVGDRCLCEITRRIQDNLRLEDILGRYGGEEFLVALIGVEENQAVEIAERIRKSIDSGDPSIAEDIPPLTVSIGIAIYRPGRDHVQQTLQDADRMLRQCKQQGKNQVALAD